MQLSWEQLQLSANAGRRRQARAILDLGQLITAGAGDKNAWKKKQEQLLKEIRIGL